MEHENFRIPPCIATFPNVSNPPRIHRSGCSFLCASVAFYAPVWHFMHTVHMQACIFIRQCGILCKNAHACVHFMRQCCVLCTPCTCTCAFLCTSAMFYAHHAHARMHASWSWSPGSPGPWSPGLLVPWPLLPGPLVPGPWSLVPGPLVPNGRGRE